MWALTSWLVTKKDEYIIWLFIADIILKLRGKSLQNKCKQENKRKIPCPTTKILISNT